MNSNDDDLRKYYAGLSDEALLSIHRDELVDAAQECLDRELAGRNLHATPSAEEPRVDDEELVAVDSFVFPDEAKLARGLLEGAGIPCYLANEHTLGANWNLTNALGGLKLMVPADLLLEAREILNARVSDEELLAESEASGDSDSAPV